LWIAVLTGRVAQPEAAERFEAPTVRCRPMQLESTLVRPRPLVSERPPAADGRTRKSTGSPV